MTLPKYEVARGVLLMHVEPWKNRQREFEALSQVRRPTAADRTELFRLEAQAGQMMLHCRAWGLVPGGLNSDVYGIEKAQVENGTITLLRHDAAREEAYRGEWIAMSAHVAWTSRGRVREWKPPRFVSDELPIAKVPSAARHFAQACAEVASLCSDPVRAGLFQLPDIPMAEEEERKRRGSKGNKPSAAERPAAGTSEAETNPYFLDITRTWPRKSDKLGSEQAYRAARLCLTQLSMLAFRARNFEPSPKRPSEWQDLADLFGSAFVAWLDLNNGLSTAVVARAQATYAPGSPSIKLGKLRPHSTVIQAIAAELGVYLRNVLYQDRSHPLEPDCTRLAREALARASAKKVAEGNPADPPFGWGDDYDKLKAKETPDVLCKRLGIKTYADVVRVFANDWKKQDPAHAHSAALRLRFGSIDFDDVEVLLSREYHAITAEAAAVGKRGTHKSPMLPVSRRGLLRLGATTAKDLKIVADLKEGLSYRKTAKRHKVGRGTVERVAIAYGLTGHAPETVPLAGTLEDNLTIRGKPRKQRVTRDK